MGTRGLGRGVGGRSRSLVAEKVGRIFLILPIHSKGSEDLFSEKNGVLREVGAIAVGRGLQGGVRLHLNYEG